MLFTSDIQAQLPRRNKLAGLFGVFDIDDNMVGAHGTRKKAQEWLDSWVFEGQDVAHWAIRKIPDFGK